jgi:hypothetical protein
MTKTIVAVYEDFPTANAAVRRLVENGVARDTISIIASDERGEYKRHILKDDALDEPQEASGDATGGAVKGAGIGAVLGGLSGLLVGLGVIAIPGIGPVIAAGPLAAAVTGMLGAGAGVVAGGAAGGLVGALVDRGVPEENAQLYTEAIRRGGVLVAVRADDDLALGVRDILNELDPIDIEEQAVQWREQNRVPETESRSSLFSSNQYQLEKADYLPDEHDQGYEAFDSAYRHHYETFLASSGTPYEEYLPIYEYGYNLAIDESYRHRHWEEIEPEVRREWERRGAATPWEEFESSVQHAWREVREAMK